MQGDAVFMKILSVTSEIFPLIKTGGLADVTGSLPKFLKACGVHTKTLVPGYPTVLRKLKAMEPLVVFDEVFGEPATLMQGRHGDLDLLVLHAPGLYDRPGGPYVDDGGNDHEDNWRRFAALSVVAAEIAGGLLPHWQPDVVHTHDWQSALTSVYMRYGKGRDIPCVLTVHNLAFQGQFHAGILEHLGLPFDAMNINCLEYHGDVSFLKGGLQTADLITTVSPTYAREILTPEFGMGMQGVLNERRPDLIGIVNGIDPDMWNPATDPALLANYDYLGLRSRRINRRRVEEEFGLHHDDSLLFAVVSRLTWQKGLDMLAEVADDLVANGGKLIVFGKGDRSIEDMLAGAAARHPGRIAVRIGYDEPTAHLIQGGVDSIVQPSRFEPCGLTQLYALRYGSVPVVSRTGGLAETIIDANDAAVSARVATGFQFHPVDTEGLRLALHRAFAAYRDPRRWARLQHQGMKAHFSWDRSAQQYASLYGSLLARRSPTLDWAIRATG